MVKVDYFNAVDSSLLNKLDEAVNRLDVDISFRSRPYVIYPNLVRLSC